MYIPLKPLFSRHKGIGVQFTDEPTGNLDSSTGEEIMKLFHELHANGNTIVLITHDNGVADEAERKIFIRDGKVSEVSL
jgi:putative ABC transport system ATP-binding protein